MCVRSVSPPEKTISRCFPAASTRSIVCPRSGVWSSTRARWGRTVSKRMTVRPARARCNVRAVRKMVSPSGTFLKSLRRLHEARLGEKRRDLADLTQQQRAPSSVLDLRRQNAGDLFRERGPHRLVLGEEGSDLLF